jgi:hypothetical protein
MRLFIASLLMLTCALGCLSCGDTEQPTAPHMHLVYRVPEVVAVITPDSLALGQAAPVVVQWINSGCESLSRFDVHSVADTVFLMPVVQRDTTARCTLEPWVYPDVWTIPASDLPAGTRYVAVQHQGPAIVAPLVVGSAPDSVVRISIRVEDRESGAPVAGARVSVWNVFVIGDAASLVGEVTTDASGEAAYIGSCDMRFIDAYELEVESPAVAAPNTIGWWAVRCGEPDHVVFRVH